MSYVLGVTKGKYTGFSVDTQDLCYSLPQHGLQLDVRRCIEDETDEVFNNCGMSLNALRLVLSLYLESTHLIFNKMCTFKNNEYVLDRK